MSSSHNQGFFSRVRRYLIAGVLTAIPIWITWVIFEFFVRQLSGLGRPWVRGLSNIIEHSWPNAARWLLEPWFQSGLALVMTLIGLYLLGWAATQVLGKKLIALMDAVINRIPLVKKIYGATKQLISVMQQRPEGMHRVVLIEFPTPEMKAVGFVTRIMNDEVSGEEVAAVYVPTTPNPTSGYLELVPVKRLVATDWTMDEAMTFIISGGAVGPDQFSFRNSGNTSGT